MVPSPLYWVCVTDHWIRRHPGHPSCRLRSCLPFPSYSIIDYYQPLLDSSPFSLQRNDTHPDVEAGSLECPPPTHTNTVFVQSLRYRTSAMFPALPSGQLRLVESLTALPTPAAARYIATGEPSPPHPTTRTEPQHSRSCAATPNAGSTRWRLYRSA